MAEVAASHSLMDQNTKPTNSQELLDNLDDLLEQYLQALDRYQKARQELSTDLASGFLSLAHANFTNKGHRYGQDYYDERMQALRRVEISSVDNGDTEVDTVIIEKHGVTDEARNVDVGDGVDEKTPTSSAKSDDKERLLTDPLRWYGVLVPPALRTAQGTFITVVESSVPSVLLAQQELRALEIKIGRTRKAIKKLEKV